MQTYEYVYNTPYFDGKRFAYWTSYGFMKRDNDDGDLSGFLRGWAETRGRLPRQPLRAAAFVAEYDPADDRYDEEYEDAFGVSNIHNVSEEGQAMLYGCSRTAGLPLGFACGWEGLLALTPEQTDLLVLPSLAHAPEGVLAKIRALHQAGVSLFATSEVTGLEDLFGVKRAPRKAKIRALEYGEETEFVTPYEASFGYEPHGARAALTADGLPALLTYRRTALLNAPASELGRYSFLGNWQTGKESVSLLLKAACEQALRALSAPLAKADGAGITLFRDENGRLTLLAIDYSPYESFSENEPREVAVRLNLNGVTDAPGADNRFFEGGELREIALSLRPHEAKLITLCERAN